jgi:hypothetical protein
MTDQDTRERAAAALLQWLISQQYPLDGTGWKWTVEPKKPDPDPDADS